MAEMVHNCIQARVVAADHVLPLECCSLLGVEAPGMAEMVHNCIQARVVAADQRQVLGRAALEAMDDKAHKCLLECP